MFAGFYTALTTPFRDGKLDVAALEKQIAFQAAGGAQGLVPVGTTGESPTLSHEEHRKVFDVAVSCAKGTGMKVVAGTGSNATEEALELTRYAHKIGCDGALMVSPYYNKPTQEGLYRHFQYIASRVDIPIMLYNIPGRTSITMSAQTMGRLAADCPTIVAVKEATGDLNLASEIAATTKLEILSGDDSLTLPLMAVGAIGIVSVGGNIVPAELRKLTDLCAADKFEAARAEHLRLFELFRALFIETNPIGIKTAMKLLGRDTGELRLPMCQAQAITVRRIQQTLINFGLLSDVALV
jgi:4-hydroxy-tetrahydrodipicolinate synthase